MTWIIIFSDKIRSQCLMKSNRILYLAIAFKYYGHWDLKKSSIICFALYLVEYATLNRKRPHLESWLVTQCYHWQQKTLLWFVADVLLFLDLFSASWCAMNQSFHFSLFPPFACLWLRHIICFPTRNLQKVEEKGKCFTTLICNKR